MQVWRAPRLNTINARLVYDVVAFLPPSLRNGVYNISRKYREHFPRFYRLLETREWKNESELSQTWDFNLRLHGKIVIYQTGSPYWEDVVLTGLLIHFHLSRRT